MLDRQEVTGSSPVWSIPGIVPRVHRRTGKCPGNQGGDMDSILWTSSCVVQRSSHLPDNAITGNDNEIASFDNVPSFVEAVEDGALALA